MELEKEIKQKKFRNEAHKLGVNLIYTFNWFNDHVSSSLREFGITSQQFNVLRILRGHQPEPATIKTIRERMLDKMSDASRIVEKLRLKGFVERSISESDRRSCEVIITEKGLRLLKKIDQNDESFDLVFKNLDQSEIRQINNLLDKIRG